MQQIIRTITYSILFCLIIVSCSKKEDISKPTFQNKIITVSNSEGNGMNWLVFNSIDDYIFTINELNKGNDSVLSAFENSFSFVSMRNYYSDEEREHLGVWDDILCTVLNPEGKIQINNYIFELDLVKDSVYAYNISNDKLYTFSVDEDVLDVVFGQNNGFDLVETENELCASNRNDFYDYQYVFEHPDLFGRELTVKCKMKYQRAGIYFSLIMSIKRSGVYLFSAPFDIGVRSISGYYVKKGSYTNNWIAPIERIGGGNHYFYCPVQSVRKLKKFNWNGCFELIDYGSEEQNQYIHVTIHKG